MAMTRNQQKAMFARMNSKVRPVAMAYADSHIKNFNEASKIRNLDFDGTFTDKNTASDQIRTIKQYNDFNPSKVNKVLTDNSVKSVRVARESSPAIYVKTDDPVTIRNKLKMAKADEVDVKGKDNKLYIIRAWWD